MKVSYCAVLLGLLFSTAQASELDFAPPSFTVAGAFAAGKKAVYVDFKKSDLTFKIDAATKTATGIARIEFSARDKGYPIIDLKLKASSVQLNGKDTSLKSIKAPGDETTYMLVDSEVSPGPSTLDIEYDLTPVVQFEAGKAALLFSMFDVDPDRSFLEQYAPSNIEFDTFNLTIDVQLSGAGEKHTVFANGEVVTSSNRWKVKYPDFYRSSSFFFHLVPEASITVSTKTFKGKKNIPVTLYAANSYASKIPQVMKDSLDTLKELEGTYGGYSHPQMLVYVTNDEDLSMEYAGATISFPEHIDHEIFHSFFGRSVMPVDGNSGWMDEGMARWRDDKYVRKALGLSAKPVNLGGFSPYRRLTDSKSYAKGSRFFSGIDEMLASAGGLRPVLAQYYSKYIHEGVTTEDLKKFLMSKTGLDLDKYFDRYVFGIETVMDGVCEAEEEDATSPSIHMHVRPSDEQIRAIQMPDSLTAPKPLALVYRGTGACTEGCATSAAEMATLEGFRVKYVTEKVALTAFKGASLWIQPGGESLEAAAAMSPELKAAIREFVKNGGGYVGFCAGGLLSTSLIGESKVEGLGIMPGISRHYKGTGADAEMLSVDWGGKSYELYFEGGPYFEKAGNAEPVGMYSNGQIASMRASFGKGRVFVTGPHPEAPQSWRDSYRFKDSDGLDYILARQMVQWAARSSH